MYGKEIIYWSQGRIQKFWKGGGCTKFSGPKLPCSRFDPFLNLLYLPPFEILTSILEYSLALEYMEIQSEMFEVLYNV